FGAATSAGQLIFVPSMMALTVSDGWRAGLTLMIVACVAVAVPVLLFMRDRPQDVGARPYGEGATVSAAERADDARGTPLATAIRTRDFWLLAGSSFICEVQWLYAFAFLSGLDWLATVPPTANLTATIFGRASLGQLYGWIFFSHMTGAAIAAYAGGYFHTVLGDYHLMFISAAIFGF